jgi:hypothetical protein
MGRETTATECDRWGAERAVRQAREKTEVRPKEVRQASFDFETEECDRWVDGPAGENKTGECDRWVDGPAGEKERQGKNECDRQGKREWFV